MINLDSNTEKCICIPFKGLTEKEVAKTISEVHRITYHTICEEHKRIEPQKTNSLLQTLGESIEVKPGIFGISIDLKELFSVRK